MYFLCVFFFDFSDRELKFNRMMIGRVPGGGGNGRVS